MTNGQNTVKISEVKEAADKRENRKSSESTRIYENKLFVAEQNREKEIQKKLENIKKHVGFFFFYCLIKFLLSFYLVLGRIFSKSSIFVVFVLNFA